MSARVSRHIDVQKLRCWKAGLLESSCNQFSYHTHRCLRDMDRQSAQLGPRWHSPGIVQLGTWVRPSPATGWNWSMWRTWTTLQRMARERWVRIRLSPPPPGKFLDFRSQRCILEPSSVHIQNSFTMWSGMQNYLQRCSTIVRTSHWNATLLPITLSQGLGCLLGTYKIQIWSKLRNVLNLEDHMMHVKFKYGTNSVAILCVRIVSFSYSNGGFYMKLYCGVLALYCHSSIS